MKMPSSEADAAGGGGGGGDQSEISKRQRRKQLATSTKNVIPQQPKLDNAEARAKAQLRVAGVNVVPTTALDVNDPGIRFGRLLGSTEQRQRHKAVMQLKAYLKARCAMDQVGLSELDLLKLWKGLWYTLYMADKTAVQDELSKNLVDLLWSVAGTEEEDLFAGESYLEATKDDDDNDNNDDEENDDDNNDGVIMQEIENTLDNDQDNDNEIDEETKGDDDDGSVEDDSVPNNMVPHCRGAHLASLFVKTFFATIRREWGSMDKYRVDKFYTLIRLMMAQVYTYMARRQWHMGILRLFNDALYEEILSVTPNGLRCHVIDVTMEELCKANSQASMSMTEAIFCCVLEPYFAMVQGVDDKVVQQRIVDNILIKFLMEYSVVGDTMEQENNHVLDQVHVGTVADFIFDLGSDKTTKTEYRKILYSTHKEFKRQINKAGVDLDIRPHHDHNHDHHDNTEGSDDEVPQLQLVEDVEIKGLVQDMTSEEVEIEVEPKRSKKKRKVENDVVLGLEMDESSIGPVKKKKKKSKKKKDSTESLEEMVKVKCETTSNKEKKDSSESIKEKMDEEIVISVADQKKAKKLAKREKAAVAAAASQGNVTKTVTTKKSKKEKEEEAESRRVSFGQVNHSKSHKASMRDLKNASPKPVPIMTPDKSILRVKTPNSKDATRNISKKSKRKKAVDSL
jgi:Nucleolar protein,Nop52